MEEKYSAEPPEVVLTAGLGPSEVTSSCSGRGRAGPGRAGRGADACTSWAPAVTRVTEADKWTPLRLGRGRMFRWVRGSGPGEREAPPGKGGEDPESDPQEGDREVLTQMEGGYWGAEGI